MIQFWMCLAAVLAADDALTRTSELGPVKATVTLSPAEPTIGDEVVLEIRVEAAATVDVLMPEFGEALSRYTILDFVPRQHVEADGSTVHTQRYTLQPYLSGKQSIPPILIEFVDHRPGQKPSPDDLDAYELLTERLDFEVASVLPSAASDELNPPLGELELARSGRGRTWMWLLPVTWLLSATAAAAIVLWYTRRRRAVRRSAYEIARARLDALLGRDVPQDAAGIEAFFVEISAVIRRYLEDRFELRAPELTTEEFLAVAGNSGALSHDHQSLLRDFLRQADLVKFAGVEASEKDIRRSAELAVRFLEETRENAPWIEVTGENAEEWSPAGAKAAPAPPADTESKEWTNA